MASRRPANAFPLPWQDHENQQNHQPRQNRENIPEPRRQYSHVSPEVRDMVYFLLEEGHWHHSPVLITYASEAPLVPTIMDQASETGLEMDNMTRAAGIPTAEHVLNSLPSVTVPSHNEADECAICMDKMSGGEEYGAVTQLPCAHMFHRGCVGLWLCNHNTCPLCRFMLPAD